MDCFVNVLKLITGYNNNEDNYKSSSESLIERDSDIIYSLYQSSSL